MSFQLLGGTVTELKLLSQPGDPIGLGLNYDFTPLNGTFSSVIPLPFSPTGPLDVSFAFTGNQLGTFADVAFAAPNHDALISGATYLNAARYLSQMSNQPGLNVDLDGRGLNTLTGSFTVLEAVYGPDQKIQHFGATFVQDQSPAPPTGNGLLSGTFYYNFDASLVATPEPSSFILVGGGVLLMLWARFRGPFLLPRSLLFYFSSLRA